MRSEPETGLTLETNEPATQIYQLRYLQLTEGSGARTPHCSAVPSTGTGLWHQFDIITPKWELSVPQNRKESSSQSRPRLHLKQGRKLQKPQLVTKNSTVAKTVGPSQRPWFSRHFFITCYFESSNNTIILWPTLPTLWLVTPHQPSIYFHIPLIVLRASWKCWKEVIWTQISSQLELNSRDFTMSITSEPLSIVFCSLLLSLVWHVYYTCISHGLTSMNFDLHVAIHMQSAPYLPLCGIWLDSWVYVYRYTDLCICIV